MNGAPRPLVLHAMEIFTTSSGGVPCEKLPCMPTKMPKAWKRCSISGFPWPWGYPTMDGLYGENPIKMDDLGVPLFQETSIWRYIKLVYEKLDWKPTVFQCKKPGGFVQMTHSRIRKIKHVRMIPPVDLALRRRFLSSIHYHLDFSHVWGLKSPVPPEWMQKWVGNLIFFTGENI